MQTKLFIFKLKSLKDTKTKWESVSHFLWTHEDRTITKEEKPILVESNYYKKYLECNGCIFNHFHNNELYKIQCYTQELHDIAVNTYFKPHEDKGIWEYTELFSTDLTPATAQALRKAEKKFSMLLHKYEKRDGKK